ncbi:Tetratricopeptide repeat-containing protein [Planococcus halocryophilus Or1]|uniref:tetratricopeptide repeat protein n=1 Tax=Planococcus halocryophilus TaxID=1215089 RepID=UPI0002B85ECA|nr:tetratricopeptide repeat protein [Planococcus halocryophilus]EMF46754.1 Tetratricopeptide repeat-containing protein [Planococcus halocryophilus Or1]
MNVIENALSAGENLNKLSFWKGLILQEIKEFNRAIAAYSKGIRDDKQFYFYIANCYRLMGKAEEALQTFDKATKENPETSFFQYHKSNYLREIGRHLEAIVVMDQLLENSSNRTDYLFHKANSLRALEKHNEAIQAMNIAIHYDASSDLFKEHKNLSIKLIKVSKKN